MTTKWKLDPSHSQVMFKVKHLMITYVMGFFKTFNLEMQTEDDEFTHASKIEFVADSNSISTNNDERDENLRSSEFFDTEKYATIKFIANQFKPTESKGKTKPINSYPHKLILTGEITIKDICKPIILNVDFGGIVIDPYGHTKAGFSIFGKLKRTDFNLNWGITTESGQFLLSDEVNINCEIQLMKQVE